MLLVGCTDSHLLPGQPCELAPDGSSGCAEGTYCARTLDPDVRTCREICSGEVRRCDSGETCIFTEAGAPLTCWSGGDASEGEACGTTLFDCARALSCSPDFSGPELTGTCEPTCEVDEDCRSGEVCILESHCAPPCDPTDATTCPEGAVCDQRYCTWAPRAADCDRDGVPDCPLGQICYRYTTVWTCEEPS